MLQCNQENSSPKEQREQADSLLPISQIDQVSILLAKFAECVACPLDSAKPYLLLFAIKDSCHLVNGIAFSPVLICGVDKLP